MIIPELPIFKLRRFDDCLQYDHRFASRSTNNEDIEVILWEGEKIGEVVWLGGGNLGFRFEDKRNDRPDIRHHMEWCWSSTGHEYKNGTPPPYELPVDRSTPPPPIPVAPPYTPLLNKTAGV